MDRLPLLPEADDDEGRHGGLVSANVSCSDIHSDRQGEPGGTQCSSNCVKTDGFSETLCGEC